MTLKNVFITGLLVCFTTLLVAQTEKISGEYLSGLGDKKSFKMVSKERNTSYCKTFLDAFPESKYRIKVVALYDELSYIDAYAAATNTYTVEGLKQYITAFPKGKYVEKAKEAIDVVSWQNAKNLNTKAAYQHYLQHFPEGKAKVLAERALEEWN